MLYIGKVLLTNEWESLADLIQDQVSGQSSFAFDSEKTYLLQGEGVTAVRLCDASAEPTDNLAGLRIDDTQIMEYTPSTGTLYTRCDLTQKTGNTDFGKVYLKICEK